MPWNRNETFVKQNHSVRNPVRLRWSQRTIPQNSRHLQTQLVNPASWNLHTVPAPHSTVMIFPTSEFSSSWKQKNCVDTSPFRQQPACSTSVSQSPPSLGQLLSANAIPKRMRTVAFRILCDVYILKTSMEERLSGDYWLNVADNGDWAIFTGGIVRTALYKFIMAGLMEYICHVSFQIHVTRTSGISF